MVLGAIPQVREGMKMLSDILNKLLVIFKKKDIYTYKSKGEKVKMTRILKSEHLDVIKIDTTSHDLGVQSERAWLKRYYSNFEYPMQYVDSIQTEQGKKIFDVFPISHKTKSKDIYFDITNFYNEPLKFLMDTNEYNKYKIKSLYRKTEK